MHASNNNNNDNNNSARADIIFWALLADASTVLSDEAHVHGPINAVIVLAEVVLTATPLCWADMAVASVILQFYGIFFFVYYWEGWGCYACVLRVCVLELCECARNACLCGELRPGRCLLRIVATCIIISDYCCCRGGDDDDEEEEDDDGDDGDADDDDDDDDDDGDGDGG